MHSFPMFGEAVHCYFGYVQTFGRPTYLNITIVRDFLATHNAHEQFARFSNAEIRYVIKAWLYLGEILQLADSYQLELPLICGRSPDIVAIHGDMAYVIEVKTHKRLGVRMEPSERKRAKAQVLESVEELTGMPGYPRRFEGYLLYIACEIIEGWPDILTEWKLMTGTLSTTPSA